VSNFISEVDSSGSVLHDQIVFLASIDRLKQVVRQSPVSGLPRKENSAEHSWHVAMYAAVLAESVRPEADAARVVKMLLIHDIVEIEAGDTPIHGDATAQADQAERELLAAENLFALLPSPQGEQFLNLWKEFENGESADAQLGKALDRLQPLIQNVMMGGGTWTDNDVSRDQVLARYGPTISTGSSELWEHAKSLVESHFSSVNGNDD
jgi:putative hydrolases of HD superfamily